MLKSFLIGAGKTIWYAYLAPLLIVAGVFGFLAVAIGGLPR